MNTKVISALEQLRNFYSVKEINNEYVICNPRGGITRHTYMQAVFSKMVELADIKPISIHSLRHYFASSCIANGIEVFEVST